MRAASSRLTRIGATPREQFISQVVVGFALRAQAPAIHANRKCLLDRARAKARSMGRDQPGPAQNVAFTKGLNRDCPPRRGVKLDGNVAPSDQVKPIDLVISPKDDLTRLEQDICGTSDNQFQVFGLQSLEKRMLGEDGFKSGCHRCSPLISVASRRSPNPHAAQGASQSLSPSFTPNAA